MMIAIYCICILLPKQTPLLGEFCHLSPAAVVNTLEPATIDAAADSAGGIRQHVLQTFQREQSVSSPG